MTDPNLTQYGLPRPTVDERLGLALYGDDFGAGELEIWFRNEENGYFHLQGTEYASNNEGGFEYLAADTFHFYDRLEDRHFPTCLALGCADGADVSCLATKVDRFVAIEPARKWWREMIGGKPSQYHAPCTDGSFELPDASIDLATVYGVLHHIPHVSATMAELGRVLKPGGILLLREPIVSMGDFTRPRPGLTAHERGIPEPLLDRMFAENRIAVRYKARTRFNALFHLLAKLGANSNSRLAVRIDALLCRLTGFNKRYCRTRSW
jgi:SAM-dependent methyltransferase